MLPTCRHLTCCAFVPRPAAECDPAGLTHHQKCDLLRRLRERLQQLVGRVLAARPDLAPLVPHYMPRQPVQPSAAEAAALQELLLLTTLPLPGVEATAAAAAAAAAGAAGAAAPGGLDVHKCVWGGGGEGWKQRGCCRVCCLQPAMLAEPSHACTSIQQHSTNGSRHDVC
jgi:hypothetical protein